MGGSMGGNMGGSMGGNTKAIYYDITCAVLLIN